MQTMPGIACTDCHTYASDVEESNSTMYHGHSWDIFVDEEDGSETVSCQACHQNLDAAASQSKILAYQEEAQARQDSAVQKFIIADSLMEGNTDPGLQAKLAEAETNLSLVDGDESGGFHNHKYLMALLANVIQNADEIIDATGIQETEPSKLPQTYALMQNYPNPFNAATIIAYDLPREQHVNISIYNSNGQLVATLVDGQKPAGSHTVHWNAENVGSGIYFYRIVAGSYSSVHKCAVIK